MQASSNGVEEHRTSPIEVAVERSAKQISWLQGIVGALIAVFIAGGIAFAYVDKFATKDEVAAALASHSASNDSHATIAKDVEALKLNLGEQHNDIGWIKDSLGRLLDQNRIPRPPDRATAKEKRP
jgi:hypothetical protein